MSLKQIKNKIISTKKTGKVTKAMEAVSAVKMRKTQEQAFAARAYARAAVRILRNIAQSSDNALAAYKSDKATGKPLIIVVTSDKGLAGSVNSAVLKLAEKQLHGQPADLICIGRKAVEFAGRTAGCEIVQSYTNTQDAVTMQDVAAIAQTVASGYSMGAYNTVHVIYQNFISTFEQKPIMRQMLPLRPEVFEEMVRDIVPKRGKYAEETAADVAVSNYTIEPNAEELLTVLMSQLMQTIVFHALIESKASEHSARMVAMKNATDKSKEIAKALTVKFNKARQAAITAEVSEITAGTEALKS